jgi:hypothetical protein
MLELKMKKNFLSIFLPALFIALAACGSVSSANTQPANNMSAPPSVPAVVEPAPQPKAELFEGDGGKGIRLTVLEPAGKGLAKEEQYLTSFVQGILTGDLNRVTALTILDRQNLDKVISEQLHSFSGIYSEDERIRIGELTNAQLMLTGDLLKTRTGFSLQLAITDTQKGERRASATITATSLEFEKATIIKDAALQLLGQLGIKLTEKGKTILYSGVQTQAAAVNAEAALAKALTAQKNGTLVEALSYYYQAVNYDSTLSEAASRLNILTADISSGNMGEDVRNDIQWRKNWVARLEECERYFAGYMKEPAPYTLFYSTDLKQGKVDYAKETLEIGFTLYLIPNDSWFDIPQNVVNQVQKGLRATGRAGDWGLNWPAKSTAGASPFTGKEDRLAVTVQLLNDKGKVIGSQNVTLPYGWKTGFSDEALSLIPVDSRMELRFTSVKADDITDKLNINIASINGENAQTASKNKRINIMPSYGEIYDRGRYAHGRYFQVAPQSSERQLNWNDAKTYCDSLNIGGYNDWRLPNREELDWMYKNLKAKGLGGFSDSWYWSSSEHYNDFAWYQSFSDGYNFNYLKNNSIGVRAVRAFNP